MNEQLPSNDSIGWIGLGGMGGPMAANVARAGFDLIVCDLRAGPVETLRGLGAAAAGSAAEVGAACDVLFVSLPGPAASEQVADEVLRGPIRPDVYVELSTLSPATMCGLAQRAAHAGVAFLDVPVSGSVRARTEGTLAVIAGGDEAAFERIRPVLDTIGANVFLLGPVGSGSVAKLANNLIGLTTLVTCMEGMLLGIRNGLDADVLRDVIMTASGACPGVLGVAHQLRTRRYRHPGPPQAAVHIVIKDLEIALELAADVGLPVRTAAAALEAWRDAAATGLADEEMWTLLDHLESAATSRDR